MRFIPFADWLINTNFLVGVGPVVQVYDPLKPYNDSIPEKWEVFVQIAFGTQAKVISKTYPSEDFARDERNKLMVAILENEG